MYVAKNKGYFKQAGLDVDIVAVAQAGAEQAVNNGVADFAPSNLTNAGIYTTVPKIKQVAVQQAERHPGVHSRRTRISNPRKDFDGKPSPRSASNESDAVIRRRSRPTAAKAEPDKVTVARPRPELSSKTDFGGFCHWEGVQADMYGPKLNCFTEPDYGVPGNADTIGVITNNKTISQSDSRKKFVQATKKGYEYAYSHP